MNSILDCFFTVLLILCLAFILFQLGRMIWEDLP